jgi:two-component system, NarL family, sensor histidine kinase DesK
MIKQGKEAADMTDVVADKRFGPGDSSKGVRALGMLFTAVWLLYLVQPVVDLFGHNYSALYIGGALAIVVTFSAVYLIVVPSWPHPPARALTGLGILAALAVAGCVFYGGTGASTLWIFVSSASGLLVPDRRWAVRAVIACGVCYVIFCLTGHVDRTDFLLNLLPTVLIGLAMVGLRRQVALMNELRQARETVAKLAANEERLRLARDMHDLTGQSLSMITLKSELAARLLQRLPESHDRDRVREEIEQVAAVSRQTLHDIREAVSGYRRPTLAVEIITARTALEAAGIAPRDDADLALLSGTFDPDAEATLAWCLREAVTNVVRHSGARNCHISLTRHGSTLSLAVRDDGEGHAKPDECDIQPPMAASVPHPAGTGLRGMSERLAAVGGGLEIIPGTIRGFAVIASVPVHCDATVAM